MKLGRFAIYAWTVLGYNLLVVLWGAYVRASGSGAGCGSHWPLCNGVVVPRPEEVATLLEFRLYPKGHRVRKGAATAMAFMLLEALLGAGLVLFELVADNASMVRAF